MQGEGGNAGSEAPPLGGDAGEGDPSNVGGDSNGGTMAGDPNTGGSGGIDISSEGIAGSGGGDQIGGTNSEGEAGGLLEVGGSSGHEEIAGTGGDEINAAGGSAGEFIHNNEQGGDGGEAGVQVEGGSEGTAGFLGTAGLLGDAGSLGVGGAGGEEGGCEVFPEVCDNLDNDCDERIDEGLPTDGLDNCGACGRDCRDIHASASMCVEGQCVLDSCLGPDIDPENPQWNLDQNPDSCEMTCERNPLFQGEFEEGLLANDSDQDGVIDTCDNCVNVLNPNQNDLDEDGIGDLCDEDIDNDGIPNLLPVLGQFRILNPDEMAMFDEFPFCPSADPNQSFILRADEIGDGENPITYNELVQVVIPEEEGRDFICAIDGNLEILGLNGFNEANDEIVVQVLEKLIVLQDSLREIHGKLRIVNSAHIRQELSFESLFWIADELEIRSNDNLRGLKFPKVITLGGDITVANNLMNTTLEFFRVQFIQGSIDISLNQALQSIKFSDVQEIGGDVYIAGQLGVPIGPSLRDINMRKLRHLGGDLRINLNDELPRIRLVKLEQIEGSLVIGQNSVLTEILAPQLHRIGGGLQVDQNTSLETIGMHNLHSIESVTRFRDEPYTLGIWSNSVCDDSCHFTIQVDNIDVNEDGEAGNYENNLIRINSVRNANGTLSFGSLGTEDENGNLGVVNNEGKVLIESNLIRD